jgi:adenosine kinase
VRQRTGWDVSEITRRAEALIVTRGAAGSTIYTRGEELDVPAAPAREVVDPTGCGDAYRAGLIHGLLHALDWRATGHIASLLGAIKIESRGTQNHRVTAAEFAQRLAAAYP